MAATLQNVTVPDQYSAACTLQDVSGAVGGSFDIESEPVFYQLQWGPPSQREWGPEGYAKPGGGTISQGATGIRFRNAVAGNAATVSAYIAGPGQPVLQVASTSSA